MPDLLDLPLTAPAPVFFVLGLVILLAPLAAERVRLPGVIGLVVAGVVVGPEGLGLLERAGAIAQLGGVGLLYLMFLAGLELDLAVLADHRKSAVVFGLVTFAIPMSVGTGWALAIGFGTAAAVLIGSLWASHTLVAYPIIRRSGIITDPSVAASVGATVITDTLALLVLAIVAGSHQNGGDVSFLLGLLPGIGLLAVVTLWLLPRLARWFFIGVGMDRTVRFLFVLSALLGSAVLAEVIGIEGIVGAFLAGLALNPLVPNGGTLMQRVEFVGSALFIPIFLVSVGMLVDLAVVLDPRTLALAAAFTAAAMGSKAAAAFLAGRLFGFDRYQIGVMFALSNAQAAATLAATIVGFEIGLLDRRVVNAVLIVILVTVVVASWAADRSVRGFRGATPTPSRMGRSVLVPIANPIAAPDLVQLAAWVSHADGGEVVPLHVVTVPDPERVRVGRSMLGEVMADAGRFGAEMEAVVRVDRSVSRGVVNTVLERDASLVILGWKGTKTTKDRLLGSLLEDIAESLPCVLAACWLPSGVPSRLVLAAGHESTVDADAVAAIEFCRRLAKGSGIPVVTASTIAGADPGWASLGLGSDLDDLIASVGSGDLVVLPAPRGPEVVGSTAEAIADASPSQGFAVVHAATFATDLEVGEVFAGP